MKPDSILHSSSGRPTENPSRGPTNRRRFDRLAHERVKLSRPSRQNGTKKNSLTTGARRFAASCSDQLMGPLRLLSDIRRRRHAPPSSTARDVQVTARHDSFVASFCFVLFCFVFASEITKHRLVAAAALCRLARKNPLRPVTIAGPAVLLVNT